MFLKALDGTNLDMEVLIAAHGNSLRALVKILDNVPEDYQKLKMWKSVFLKPQCWGHSDGCMEWRYPISVVPVFWERNRNIRDVELNRFTLAQCSTTDSKCECKTWNHSRALQLLLTRLFPQSFYSCFDDKRCFLLTYIHVQDGTNPILLLLQNCQNIIKYLGYIKSECWTEYDRMQLAGCHHVLEPFLS